MDSATHLQGLLAFTLWLVFSTSAPAACSTDHVAIVTRNDTVIFGVKIADDPKERASGLSGKASLDVGSGMLFLYETPHRAWFWMRGTNIALDIIFIDPDGTISAIKRNAQPGSHWPKSGGPNTLSVLEINGGEADAYDIQAGDRVQRFTAPCLN